MYSCRGGDFAALCLNVAFVQHYLIQNYGRPEAMLSIMPYVTLSFFSSKARFVFLPFFWVYPYFQNLNAVNSLLRAGTASVMVSYTIGLLVDMFFVTRVWLCKVLLPFWEKRKADDSPLAEKLVTKRKSLAFLVVRLSHPPLFHCHAIPLFSSLVLSLQFALSIISYASSLICVFSTFRDPSIQNFQSPLSKISDGVYSGVAALTACVVTGILSMSLRRGLESAVVS
jgi:hypothetical protein